MNALVVSSMGSGPFKQYLANRLAPLGLRCKRITPGEAETVDCTGYDLVVLSKAEVNGKAAVIREAVARYNVPVLEYHHKGNNEEFERTVRGMRRPPAPVMPQPPKRAMPDTPPEIMVEAAEAAEITEVESESIGQALRRLFEAEPVQPGLDTIARKLGRKAETVRVAVGTLVELGMVEARDLGRARTYRWLGKHGAGPIVDAQPIPNAEEPTQAAVVEEPVQAAPIEVYEQRNVLGWPLAKLTADDVPRILDTDLASKLEMSRPRDIRPLIERHRAALEEIGPITMRETVSLIAKTGAIKGIEQRTVNAYFLTDEQAAYVASKSETPKGVELAIGMVKLFMAWGKGELPEQRQISLADQFRLMAQVAERQEHQSIRIAQLAVDNEACVAAERIQRESALAQERADREAAIAAERQAREAEDKRRDEALAAAAKLAADASSRAAEAHVAATTRASEAMAQEAIRDDSPMGQGKASELREEMRQFAVLCARALNPPVALRATVINWAHNMVYSRIRAQIETPSYSGSVDSKPIAYYDQAIAMMTPAFREEIVVFCKNHDIPRTCKARPAQWAHMYAVRW